MLSTFALLTFMITAPAAAAGAVPAPPAVKAPSVMVMDAQSGKVLYQRDADRARPPASMTKMMTLLLAARAVESGKVRAADRVPASEEAFHTGGSQIWLEPGEQLPLQKLLRAIAIGSANDACVAVAEFLSGSQDAFVKVMNQTAKELGMTSTHFANSHGLDDPAHVTTARDMAVLGREVLHHPMLVRLLRQKEDRTIRNGKGGKLWLVNHNKLLWRLPGSIGVKTGFTNGAGFCLTGAARREGMTALAVVMGEPTSKDRFKDTAALLNWVFANYRSVEVVKRGAAVGEVSVLKGDRPAVRAVSQRGVRMTVPKGVKVKPKTVVRLKPSLRAPIRAGEPVGEVEVRLGDERTKSVLVADKGVERATFGRIFSRILKGAFHVGRAGAGA